MLLHSFFKLEQKHYGRMPSLAPTKPAVGLQS